MLIFPHNVGILVQNVIILCLWIVEAFWFISMYFVWWFLWLLQSMRGSEHARVPSIWTSILSASGCIQNILPMCLSTRDLCPSTLRKSDLSLSSVSLSLNLCFSQTLSPSLSLSPPFPLCLPLSLPPLPPLVFFFSLCVFLGLWNAASGSLSFRLCAFSLDQKLRSFLISKCECMTWKKSE